MLESMINDSVLRLEQGDLTAMDIEAIVFYASPDLVLGSGFGSAIAARGGMSIQEELKAFGTISTGEAVVTSAGELKAKYIVHAVGPRFQEAELEEKLRLAVVNALKAAEEKGIRRVAFPPMGVGFYGVPLDLCSSIMVDVFSEHLSANSSFEEVVICVLDKREFNAFQAQWEHNDILGEPAHE
jgi:O-acetyl-ADP-ribose deacetylase (regulator of RNase III)